jgi:molybdenum cofactor cytidylyltransferase
MGCVLKGNSGLWSRMSVGAVLLAAGPGTLLDGRPKALLELGGVPLVLRSLIALSGAGVDEVAIVLGTDAEAIEPVVRAFPITLVNDPAAEGTQALRLGLAALAPQLDAVIVAPAHQPLVGAQDIVDLIGAFKKRGDAALVVPRVAGDDGRAVIGQPLICDAALRHQWQAGEADPASDRWREANAQRLRWLDTANRRYRVGIDSVADLERFAAETGHRLSWPAALAEPVA